MPARWLPNNVRSAWSSAARCEAIQALEQRSDEELEAETKYKAAAMAILGARASERFDAEAARAYFQRAIAAARPQERMQIRRMADASLALAERRAGDLKDAVERLGQAPPERPPAVRPARDGPARCPLRARGSSRGSAASC